MADITDDFSFAYMKEAFVATLLELARSQEDDSDNEGDDDEGDDDQLSKYQIWKVFKAQVKILRSEMGSNESAIGESTAGARLGAYEGISSEYEEMMPLLDAMRLQSEPQQHCKATSPLAMHVGSSQGASAKGRFEGSSSVLSPIHAFAPLAKTKTAQLNEGVWEWGS